MGLEPKILYTLDTLYSRQSALPTELPRQLSWLGANLTSHSTPDEQANHQLSMKEKAGVMHVHVREMKKEGASKVKQTKQSNTAPPRLSHYVIHYITVHTVFETGHSLLEVLY